VLPQKSTDFPKLLSGETIYTIEREVGRFFFFAFCAGRETSREPDTPKDVEHASA
jgi:hypothetical protein